MHICRRAAQVVVIGLVAAAARAQDTSGTALSGRTPAENVRAAAVRQRAPGVVIGQARQRHNELIAERLRARRFGGSTGDASAPTGSGGGQTGSAGGTGGLLGSLGGLLGGGVSVGGGSGIGTETGGTGGIEEILASLPPELVQMIESLGIDLSTIPLSGRSRPAAAGGAADELPDPSRAQAQQPEDEPGLPARLGIAVLETALEETLSQVLDFPVAPLISLPQDPAELRVGLTRTLLDVLFAGLTTGLRSPQFVDDLADHFRMMMGLPVTGGSGAPTDGAGAGDTDAGGSTLEDLGDEPDEADETGSII